MRLAVIGGYGVATTFRVAELPEPGMTVLSTGREVGPGGKGSNQAIAAARLGAQVSLLTAIGDDRDGDDALRLWAAEGVEADHVVRSGSGTMAGTIAVDARGENQILIHQGALRDLTPAHVESFHGDIEQADILLVSLETPIDVAAHALEYAKSVGTRTVLNPAPAASVPLSLLSFVDVLTPNRAEVRDLLGAAPDSTPDDLAESLCASFDGTAVITLGSDGALIAESGRITRVPAASVDRVVDTTGAGDAFNAALAVRLAAGASIADAVRFACRVSAFVVQRDGVVPALPHSGDVARPEDQR